MHNFLLSKPAGKPILSLLGSKCVHFDVGTLKALKNRRGGHGLPNQDSMYPIKKERKKK